MATTIKVDPRFFDAVFMAARQPGERLVGAGRSPLRLRRRQAEREERRASRPPVRRPVSRVFGNRLEA